MTRTSKNRRVLVVFAHPEPTSFVGSLRDLVLSIAEETKAEVRQHDLYAEGFSAVLSLNEWNLHRAPPDSKPHLAQHFDDVQWCDTLVFVYPTWWSAQPAILKAWMDRVIAHDVAWTVKDGADRISPGLSNVKRLVAITTHGSSKLVNMVEGEAGKFIVKRAIRVLCSWRCRTEWLAMYDVDGSTRVERDRFTRRVERRLRRIL